jgi:hypothetical protein
LTPSTPKEREDLWEFLRPLAEHFDRDRRVAILRMLTREVASCSVCEAAIRACDSRKLAAGHLVHVGCIP